MRTAETEMSSGAVLGPEADDEAPVGSAQPAIETVDRPRVGLARLAARGKFLFAGDQKFWVRGVTYGTFRPDGSGNEYRSSAAVERDFAAITANGMNAVRLYTVPPRWLLDAAAEQGLRVMIGLPWEQHIAFLEDRRQAASIVDRVRRGVRRCAGHPAVLCYAVGNEIPAPIVRWHGARRVERFIGRLYEVAKAEDPEALVTYVNYPTTEYLQLPFLDVVAFNIYLENRTRLATYLSRVHNVVGDRPLLMAEIGLDSLRHGEQAQAKALDWQIRTTFAAGCGGAFVFAWTDEWHRGGHDIEDWKFGLTTRERRPKLALAAVRKAFAEVPFSTAARWPRISVVVCSCNGARTIRDTLEGLRNLDYPDFEVIIVDDGSADATATIAHEYQVRTISTANRGLSSARNTGLAAATGDIVAYIDDDAYPDPHWLTFLAAAFMESHHVGIGGPNIAPPGDGAIADCVANAPGGPTHVLLTDDVAEHIPGCNMAFRKECLQAIGGFDPRFRATGDDVDVCWRLQERGWTLGFSPAAVVWHHRRNSLRAYWRQQIGYGKGEALLEEKWPEKHNPGGHLGWAGRIYSKGVTRPLPLGRNRIYQGSWGSALFQSLYEPVPGTLRSLPLMPEWYLVVAGLAALATLGLFWPPLRLALPVLVAATAAPVAQAVLSGIRASFTTEPRSRARTLQLVALTAFLHLMQPLARLLGRLRHGLTPWRLRWSRGLAWPWPRKHAVWSERWRSAEDRLKELEAALRADRAPALRGGDFDSWDLWVRGGLFGSARVRMAVEEHGAGQQYVRFKIWPWCSAAGVAFTTLCGALVIGSAVDGALLVAVILGAVCAALVVRTFVECAAAEAALLRALPVEGTTGATGQCRRAA